MPTKYSTAKINRVRKLIDEGKSRDEVSEATGVNKYTVAYYATKGRSQEAAAMPEAISTPAKSTRTRTFSGSKAPTLKQQSTIKSNDWFERFVDRASDKVVQRVTDRLDTYFNQLFKD